LAVVIACRATAQRATSDTEQLGELRAGVRALIGDPTCMLARQCRAAPFGAKPCGGPWSYIIYSTATIDSAAFADAVARYNALEDELNRREGRVSDCRLVSPPQLDCVNGRCVGTAMLPAVKSDSGKRP
jgi:hypothetical protein